MGPPRTEADLDLSADEEEVFEDAIDWDCTDEQAEERR